MLFFIMGDAIFIMERLIFTIEDDFCIMEKFIFIMEDATFHYGKEYFFIMEMLFSLYRAQRGKNVRFGTRAFQLASELAGL